MIKCCPSWSLIHWRNFEKTDDQTMLPDALRLDERRVWVLGFWYCETQNNNFGQFN